MKLPPRAPFFAAALAATVWAGTAAAAAPDLSRATIAELQAQMTAGRLTSVAIVRYYLARIRRLDGGKDGVHAVLALNPHALTEAARLDAERKAHGARSVLHGIPLLVKDNIDAAGMPTTAGSLALAQNVRADAPLVARLRAAGAIILGKTNLSEWANFRSTRASSGWSAVGGLTRNPYDLSRTACGSSSGSGAAVAAGLAPAAIGTETDGSITCPASMNGLVGLKPSVGVVPRTGVVPISHSQDTPGPMAHTVADAAALMAVMQGKDGADAASGAAPDLAGAFGSVRAQSLAGVRLGVLRYPADALPMTDGLYAAALARLRAAGAVLVEVAMPDTSKIGDAESLVLKTEMKPDMAAYLKDAPAAVTARSLADLIAFNAATPAETVYFAQELFDQSEATKGLDDPAYVAARAASVAFCGANGIDKLLGDHQLAALVAPTTGPAWKIDLVYGDNGNVPAMSTLAAVPGYPHVTVPMGLADGLPVGLSFIGGKWRDAEMLSLAAGYEALAPSLPPPTLKRLPD